MPITTQQAFFDENPSLDGPDYVALVIEWDELADNLERQMQTEQAPVIEAKPARNWRTIGIGAGIGALALWALVHRLRA
jgi:hypothetical protein